MAATAAIPTIRTRHWVEFGTHKVLATCTAMPAAAKYPDLIYKVCLFHFEVQRYRNGGEKWNQTQRHWLRFA